LEADFVFCLLVGWLLDDGYGTRLFALFAIGDFKFDLLTFFERTVTTALNFGIVNEEVRTTFLSHETVTLVTIEPFNCTLYTSHVITPNGLKIEFGLCYSQSFELCFGDAIGVLHKQSVQVVRFVFKLFCLLTLLGVATFTFSFEKTHHLHVRTVYTHYLEKATGNLLTFAIHMKYSCSGSAP
jgi:hypothetical protein